MSVAAIVPAAGHSSRMGRPKLLLEIHGRPVLRVVLDALHSAGFAPIIVVVPEAACPESEPLAALAEATGALVVRPRSPPPDMRASVELGLAQLLTEPTPPGSVAICPADSPGLDSSWLRPLIARASEEPTRLLLPVVNGKRGHPVILPWSIALEIPKLPSGTGINRLVAEHTYAGDVLELEISAPGAIRDLDTPEDYASWIASE